MLLLRLRRARRQPLALSWSFDLAFIQHCCIITGERDMKGSALPQVAFDPDPPAMRLHNRLRDSETQSPTALFQVHSVEALEYGLALLRRDARPIILYHQFHFTGGQETAHSYIGTRRGMPVGVI